MAHLLRNETEVDKRLKTIRKEIASVDNAMHSLSKSRSKASPSSRSSTSSGANTTDSAAHLGQRGGGRFTDYFATGFQQARPLRHERKMQRNKAIVMILFVLLVLFWIITRFFL